MNFSKQCLLGVAGALAFSAAQAAPVQWTSAAGGNDHWYEYISTPVTDAQFVAAAQSQTHLGMTGYIATITSLAEQNFINANLFGGSVGAPRAWIGLSDAATEGNWLWLDGPEAGTNTLATFSFWAGGEPNNCCSGEDYVTMNWTSNGRWNDWGSPSFPTLSVGYVVEYSAWGQVPAPAPIALLGLGLLGMGLARRKA